MKHEIENDPVNHPSHYMGKIEVIDFLEDRMFPFHLANAIKYISRAGRKDPDKTTEDLRNQGCLVSEALYCLSRKAGEGEGGCGMNVNIPDQGKIIRLYGREAQSMIHMEECAELIQAVSKMQRAERKCIFEADTFYNLIEEMADVLICMEQIKVLYSISDQELQYMVDLKCKRQEARFNGDV